jgi:hypothetical protein
MSKKSKQIEYELMLKDAERKKRKPVDRWFLNYCKKYNSFYGKSTKEGEK